MNLPLRLSLAGRSLRRRGSLCPLLVVLSIASLCVLPARASELRRTAVVKAIEKNRAAIVNIHGQKTIAVGADELGDRGDGTRRVNGMGTGVIIDPRGYIITNFHVV